MFGRYTTGPVIKRAVVYHTGICVSIRAAGIKCGVGGCNPGWIVYVNPIAFMCPLIEPVGIAHREINAAV